MYPEKIVRDGHVYVLKSALFGLGQKSRADALKMVQQGQRAPRGWVAIDNGKDVMPKSYFDKLTPGQQAAAREGKLSEYDRKHPEERQPGGQPAKPSAAPSKPATPAPAAKPRTEQPSPRKEDLASPQELAERKKQRREELLRQIRQLEEQAKSESSGTESYHRPAGDWTPEERKDTGVWERIRKLQDELSQL